MKAQDHSFIYRHIVAKLAMVLPNDWKIWLLAVEVPTFSLEATEVGRNAALESALAVLGFQP